MTVLHVCAPAAVRTCSTMSEIVVPLVSASSQKVIAVLDIDSDLPAAFDEVDQRHLEEFCSWMAGRYEARR